MNRSINDCTRYQDWIERLQTTGGDDAKPPELLEHLEGCPHCREEEEAYRETLARLGELEPAEPPRHFFVYEESRRPSLLWGWRTLFSPPALAIVSTLLLVLTLGAMAARVQFRTDGGSLTVGLGSLPTLAEPRVQRDPELLRADFRALLEDELRARDSRLMKAVRDEISSFSDQVQRTQRDRFNQVLTSLDERFGQQLQQRDEILTDNLRSAAFEIYRTLSAQQQQDLRNLNVRLQVVEESGQIRGNQTEVLMATVMHLAQRQE